MYTCPHCKQPGISRLRKLSLGPALPATCKACGRKVGVPYSSMLALVPFIIAILFAQYVGAIVLQAVIIIVGFIVMCAIYLKLVPLEPRQ